MRKLMLDLNELSVETFDTTPSPRSSTEGTIIGLIFTDSTCDESCLHTCRPSSERCCEGTCSLTCDLTCAGCMTLGDATCSEGQTCGLTCAVPKPNPFAETE